MKIFPKLFIGDACKNFLYQIKKSSLEYELVNIISKEDLINFIDRFSSYKNYNIPVVLSDISFLSKSDQSKLLKFIDDSNIKLILLASRDNILATLISRVKEYRKFYANSSKVSYISINKAREMLSNESSLDDSSYDDRLMIYNKYNPMLAYNDNLVKSFSLRDRNRLLNILEFDNER